ncbi:MAG: hypothetical protein C0609_10475 [Deltaproteobacteria bacterium]|nr:MAG: hypothetical protein C0609_10475 [Deltaproteobacteria bacterium]
MAVPRNPEVVRLEKRIEDLRYQYDLYFSGHRRTEPAALMNEIDHEILNATRTLHGKSTGVQFQLNTLAHKFRALQTRVRKILERWEKARSGRRQVKAEASQERASTFYIDKLTIENPSLLKRRIRALYTGANAPSFDPDKISAAILHKASQVIDKPGVAAVRFTVSQSAAENAPKVKGDLIKLKAASEG